MIEALVEAGQEISFPLLTLSLIALIVGRLGLREAADLALLFDLPQALLGMVGRAPHIGFSLALLVGHGLALGAVVGLALLLGHLNARLLELGPTGLPRRLLALLLALVVALLPQVLGLLQPDSAVVCFCLHFSSVAACQLMLSCHLSLFETLA